MDISESLIHLMDGLLGAAIGGISTIYATRMVIREEAGKEQRQEEKEVHSLLDAIGVELNALWSFHMRRIGGHIEQMQDGAALEFYYPLTQDYFTVYNSNADKIGKVKNPELREAIVVCYNKCKKVVDGFKYNNELYKDYREMVDRSVTLNEDELECAKKLIHAKRHSLTEYAKFIKEDHFELKGYVDKLLQLLKTES